MQQYVIIVAGGTGQRMGAEIPKQFLKLSGRPVLMHTISAFFHYDSLLRIILVLPANQLKRWEELCQFHEFQVEHAVVSGGATRFDSVKNGLNFIADKEGLVAIHDGVRPFIKKEHISIAFETAAQTGAAILSVPSKDSVRIINEQGNVALDRNQIRLVQTPQCFQLSLLKEAFEQPYNERFTDDAAVMEAAGHAVSLVDGDYDNIKITTPEDLMLAEMLIKKSAGF